MKEEEPLIAVVVGQGYVGLPLAEAASLAGMQVYGFEVSPSRVADLNAGISHVDDLTDGQIQAMLRAGYRATSDPTVIAKADIVAICVPTPLDQGGGPDLGAVETSARTIGQHMSGGTTVILESTTYPGTTDELVIPILEGESGMVCGEDFYVAYSPERIDPGSVQWTIRNTPKLVGGADEAGRERALYFYRRFVDEVVPLMGTREAETAKLLENTYRHVNIALVNEMARFCHDLGIDIWEVIKGASTKPFGFQKFTPGPGVGGHCIPIDPNYLSFQVKKTLGYQFRFVELAQEINNSMPSYVVGRVADLLNDSYKPVKGSRVLLLGVTYKPDIADQRESPALAVANVLEKKQAVVEFHDPLVERWNLSGRTLARVNVLDDALSEADVVVLLQKHSSYNVQEIAEKATLFFDARGHEAEGFGAHYL